MNIKVRDDSWQQKIWRVPHLGGLRLIHASGITHDYPRHIHEEHCIAVVLQGTETYIFRGRSYKAGPGDLMLLNADEAHSSKSVGTEYRVIQIHPEALNRIGDEVVGRKIGTIFFSTPIVKDSLSFGHLLNLHLKLERNAPCLEHESQLITTIGLLLRRQSKNHFSFQRPGKEFRRVKLIQDYLKAHYAENVSLAQLSSIANLSPFYLLRVFSRQVGVPPHEYQTQLRIARAKRLIETGHSISQAALETGFFDQSHLTRNFKRIVAATPGAYLSRRNIVQDRVKSA